MGKTSTLTATLSAVLALIISAAISVGWLGEGRDTLNYSRIFGEILMQPSLWDLRYEPLFILFVELAALPTTNPSWIFFAVIAAGFLTKILAVKWINGNALVFLVSYL